MGFENTGPGLFSTYLLKVKQIKGNLYKGQFHKGIKLDLNWGNKNQCSLYSGQVQPKTCLCRFSPFLVLKPHFQILYPCHFKMRDFRNTIIINTKASYVGNVDTFSSMIQITRSRRNLSTYIHVSNAEIYDCSASPWVDFKRLYATLDNFDIK